MSENAIIDAMEEHADDPVDPAGRMAKGCHRARQDAAAGRSAYAQWTGRDRCVAVFVCRRCWPSATG